MVRAEDFFLVPHFLSNKSTQSHSAQLLSSVQVAIVPVRHDNNEGNAIADSLVVTMCSAGLRTL